MNKYRIENPNNNKVREYKSRTTEICSQKMVELTDEKYFKSFCLEIGILEAIEDKIEKYYRTIQAN